MNVAATHGATIVAFEPSTQFGGFEDVSALSKFQNRFTFHEIV
jgi:hypothetical protein